MRLPVGLLAVGFVLWAGALPAQQSGPVAPPPVQSPVLVIDFERVFDQSAFGRRVNDEIESESRVIAAENRRIEAELIEEERRLTDLRPTLAPEEFRRLADEFDEKVQRLRSEQDAKARAIGTRTEEARRRFLTVAQPVLEELLREAEAAVILERRSVFVSVDAIDVTDRAARLIDEQIGAGAAADTDPPPDPAPGPPPAPDIRTDPALDPDAPDDARP